MPFLLSFSWLDIPNIVILLQSSTVLDTLASQLAAQLKYIANLDMLRDTTRKSSELLWQKSVNERPCDITVCLPAL